MKSKTLKKVYSRANLKRVEHMRLVCEPSDTNPRHTWPVSNTHTFPTLHTLPSHSLPFCFTFRPRPPHTSTFCLIHFSFLYPTYSPPSLSLSFPSFIFLPPHLLPSVSTTNPTLTFAFPIFSYSSSSLHPRSSSPPLPPPTYQPPFKSCTSLPPPSSLLSLPIINPPPGMSGVKEGVSGPSSAGQIQPASQPHTSLLSSRHADQLPGYSVGHLLRASPILTPTHSLCGSGGSMGGEGGTWRTQSEKDKEEGAARVTL